MKPIKSTAIIVVLLGCSCASEHLKHDYRLIDRSVDQRDNSGAFEGVAHYKDLFCGDKRLGTVGAYSISPSGRFALFEDHGRLLLFDKRSAQTRDVTDALLAIPSLFTWNEPGGIVHVQYYEGHSPSQIQLSE